MSERQWVIREGLEHGKGGYWAEGDEGYEFMPDADTAATFSREQAYGLVGDLYDDGYPCRPVKRLTAGERKAKRSALQKANERADRLAKEAKRVGLLQAEAIATIALHDAKAERVACDAAAKEHFATCYQDREIEQDNEITEAQLTSRGFQNGVQLVLERIKRAIEVGQ